MLFLDTCIQILQDLIDICFAEILDARSIFMTAAVILLGYVIDRHGLGAQTAVFDSRIDIDNADADTLRKYIRMYMSQPSTVIDYARPSVSDLHPTMKPVGLLEILIKNSSRSGEIVVDTFGGSGSTLIACEHLGRRCRMAELDPHYCDVIVKRWEDETGKKAELCQ